MPTKKELEEQLAAIERQREEQRERNRELAAERRKRFTEDGYKQLSFWVKEEHAPAIRLVARALDEREPTAIKLLTKTADGTWVETPPLEILK
ncbi:MAG: hypothetical protein AB7E47_17430 [Desulfovibrionaceae bacterium]